MRSNYRLGVVLAGVCCLGMTSCIDSDNPLSNPEQAKPVPALAGVWREQCDDVTRYYHVGLAGDKFPPGLMQMVIVDHKKDGTIDPIVNGFVFATTLGDRHFINISVLEPEQLKDVAKTGWKPGMFKGYWIYEFRLDGDKISLIKMDWEQKKSLIKSKKLHGVIKGDQVLIQENSENLARFITSPEAANLFPPAEKEELERVK